MKYPNSGLGAFLDISGRIVTKTNENDRNERFTPYVFILEDE